MELSGWRLRVVCIILICVVKTVRLFGWTILKMCLLILLPNLKAESLLSIAVKEGEL